MKKFEDKNQRLKMLSVDAQMVALIVEDVLAKK